MGDVRHLLLERRRALAAPGREPVFLIACLIFALVGGGLYFGNDLNLGPTTAAGVSAGSVAPARVVGPRRLLTATVSQSTSAVALIMPSEPVATKVYPATPVIALALPLPAAFKIATIVFGHVGHTNGDGAYLRRTPYVADHWLVWPDTTPLVLLGREVDAEGQHWLEVRDPKNNEGWIPAQYVIR